MDPGQQFCLRWNNYQSTLQHVFHKLWVSGTFVDVTLIVEGRRLDCHRVVLSACSAYFEHILQDHSSHPHPLILLHDLPFNAVEALVVFMYRGEVNVSQEQLAALLRVAETLQVKGLADSSSINSFTKRQLLERCIPLLEQASHNIPVNLPGNLETVAGKLCGKIAGAGNLPGNLGNICGNVGNIPGNLPGNLINAGNLPGNLINVAGNLAEKLCGKIAGAGNLGNLCGNVAGNPGNLCGNVAGNPGNLPGSLGNASIATSNGAITVPTTSINQPRMTTQNGGCLNLSRSAQRDTRPKNGRRESASSPGPRRKRVRSEEPLVVPSRPCTSPSVLSTPPLTDNASESRQPSPGIVNAVHEILKQDDETDGELQIDESADQSPIQPTEHDVNNGTEIKTEDEANTQSEFSTKLPDANTHTLDRIDTQLPQYPQAAHDSLGVKERAVASGITVGKCEPQYVPQSSHDSLGSKDRGGKCESVPYPQSSHDGGKDRAVGSGNAVLNAGKCDTQHAYPQSSQDSLGSKERPGNLSGKSCERSYTHLDLEEGIEAVLMGQLTPAKAIAQYKIPRRTFFRRLSAVRKSRGIPSAKENAADHFLSSTAVTEQGESEGFKVKPERPVLIAPKEEKNKKTEDEANYFSVLNLAASNKYDAYLNYLKQVARRGDNSSPEEVIEAVRKSQALEKQPTVDDNRNVSDVALALVTNHVSE